MESKVFRQLIIIFLITQFLGLYVANALIQEEIHVSGIVSDNPEDLANPLGLIVYILIVTAILLIAIKYFKSLLLIKIMEVLAVFGTSFIVFGAIFSDAVPALALIAIVTGARIFFRKNLLMRNVASIVSAAGAGSLIGISMGVMPVLLFIALLSVYDLIAVFKTKHMITLAKSVTKENMAFTVAMPTKKHQFELGVGDLVIPMVFSVSVLKATNPSLVFPWNFFPAAAILLASLLGLLWTIDFISKRIGTALPALPPQTALMILTYIGLLFLGFV